MSNKIICPACGRPGLANGKCLLCQYDTSTNYTEYLILGESIEDVIPPSHLKLEFEKEEQLIRNRIAQIDPLARRVAAMESQLLDLVPMMNHVEQLKADNHDLREYIRHLRSSINTVLASQEQEYHTLIKEQESLHEIITELRNELGHYSDLEARIAVLEESGLHSPLIFKPQELPEEKPADLPLIPMKQFSWDDYVWGQDVISREDICTITFLSEMPDIAYDVPTWDLSEAGDAGIIAWIESEQDLKVAANGAISFPSNCEGMFSYFTQLESIHFGDADTTNVTNMAHMFLSCLALTSLTFNKKGWNTSHVTSFLGMFRGCYKLSQLNISGWETGNVTNMSHMFRDCNSLESLDLHTWDTSSVVNTGYMFYGCSNLQALNISTWMIRPDISADAMFAGCDMLKCEERSNWEKLYNPF